LQADLNANPRSCTLAAWHHPRWSSGYDGNNDFMQPLWQLLWAKGADIALAGHSHHYERFAPIDGNGAVNPADGIRSFVVGTGGANFTPINAVAKGSEVRQNTSFGLLRLALHPTSYDWNFVPVAGSTFTDAGSQSCRGVLPPPPPPPAAPAAGPAGGPPVRRAGALLAHWRVNSARARRVLRRGHIHIPARRWAPTVVRVHVAGRLAARRFVRDKRPFMMKLASWSKDRRYRHRRVTVTIRRPS
jgi:hypothetical protein